MGALCGLLPARHVMAYVPKTHTWCDADVNQVCCVLAGPTIGPVRPTQGLGRWVQISNPLVWLSWGQSLAWCMLRGAARLGQGGIGRAARV